MAAATNPPSEDRPATPGRPRDERAHAAIMQATGDLLAEVGYRNLTIEGIAARAGVGKTTVYRWWPNKAAVVIEAIQDRVPLTDVPDTGDTHEDLRIIIRSVFENMTSSTTGVVLPSLAVDLFNDPQAAEQLGAIVGSRRAAILRIFERGAERGDLPADVDAGLLLDIYTGALFFRSFFSPESLQEPIIDQLTRLILDGTIPTKPK